MSQFSRLHGVPAGTWRLIRNTIRSSQHRKQTGSSSRQSRPATPSDLDPARRPRRESSSLQRNECVMRNSRATVIIGAGIVGCSVADHLTRLGGHDVTVVDQGPLFATGGSTSHAPGLVFQTNPSQTMTQFAAYSVRRYGELGHSGRPCFRPVGSIEVARTPERWKDL